MKIENFDIEKAKAGAKVVTRDGEEVRIICFDKKYNQIVALVGEFEDIVLYNQNGKQEQFDTQSDLFLVYEEEEELTEFEEAVYTHICNIVTACEGELYGNAELKPIVKGISKELLNLARKEISKDNVIVTLSEWETLAEKFKDLPKWKKAETNMSYRGWICLSHGDMRFPHYTNEILKGEYYLDFKDLEKLPKQQNND